MDRSQVMLDVSGTRVFVVDDDADFRQSVSWLLEGAGLAVELFASAREFLAGYRERQGCVLLDVRLPGMNGLDLLRQLGARKAAVPVIVMSGHADVSMALEAIEAGAVAFLEKPFLKDQLIAGIAKAGEKAAQVAEVSARHRDDNVRVAQLTPREGEIMRLVVFGQPTKMIARRLGISVRTVDKHREHVLSKTGVHSLAELVTLGVRLGMTAREGETDNDCRRLVGT